MIRSPRSNVAPSALKYRRGHVNAGVRIDGANRPIHVPIKIVLTGGPGAGTTAVLELVRQYFCQHVMVLPESTSILFSGGFPGGKSIGAHHAAQRAIFRVQRELEEIARVEDGASSWV